MLKQKSCILKKDIILLKQVDQENINDAFSRLFCRSSKVIVTHFNIFRLKTRYIYS